MLNDVRYPKAKSESDQFKKNLLKPSKSLQNKGFSAYSEDTAHSYTWHLKTFLRHVESLNQEPKEVSIKHVEEYVKDLQNKVLKAEKSKPFYLQAVASIEIWAHMVLEKKRALNISNTVDALRKRLNKDLRAKKST